jgi:predicted PurR-regulated permease PerM
MDSKPASNKNRTPGTRIIVLRSPALEAFVGIAGVLIFLYLIRSILLPFVLGGIIAHLCTPLIDWLRRRAHVPRFVSAMGILALLMSATAIVAYVAGPALVHQITRVMGDLHGAISRFAYQLIGDQTFTIGGQQIGAAKIADDAINGIEHWLAQPGEIVTLVALAVGVLFGFILTWVILGYFLSSAPAIGRGLMWLVPPGRRDFAKRVWAELDPVLRRYFIGVLLVVLYASVAAYIGLGLILNIRHAGFLALLTGVLEIIPIVGPAASAIIAGLVAVQQSTTPWSIIAYVIYAAALRISIDQFIGPIVLGKAAYIHPVLVIFCFLSGALLFGLVGVILAVPTAIAIKSTLTVLYRDAEKEPA